MHVKIKNTCTLHIIFKEKNFDLEAIIFLNTKPGRSETRIPGCYAVAKCVHIKGIYIKIFIMREKLLHRVTIVNATGGSLFYL